MFYKILIILITFIALSLLPYLYGCGPQVYLQSFNATSLVPSGQVRTTTQNNRHLLDAGGFASFSPPVNIDGNLGSYLNLNDSIANTYNNVRYTIPMYDLGFGITLGLGMFSPFIEGKISIWDGHFYGGYSEGVGLRYTWNRLAFRFDNSVGIFLCSYNSEVITISQYTSGTWFGDGTS
jgi:hypothetical protein